MKSFNSIQDFLENDSFILWVSQKEENSFWNDFLKTYPEKAEIFNEAIRLSKSLYLNELEHNPNLNENKIWKKIRLSINETKVASPWPLNLLKLVSVFFVVFYVGFLVWQSTPTQSINYTDLVGSFNNKNQLIEVKNSQTKPLIITLEDGSKIHLSKNSRISYPIHFDKENRTVFLSGEAFFDITRNPKKPFFVYSNEIITKVLGTSFTIKAFEKDVNVTVSVKTGQVNVYNQRRINVSDPETKGIILTPNQKGIFNRDTENLSKALVEKPMPLNTIEIKNYNQSFDEVPVSQVINSLATLYGIKIIYHDEQVSKCIITTRFKNEPLPDKLDLICQLIGGSYKEVDAQIIIESKGCK
jgi:transmembrane sensor